MKIQVNRGMIARPHLIIFQKRTVFWEYLRGEDTAPPQAITEVSVDPDIWITPGPLLA